MEKNNFVVGICTGQEITPINKPVFCFPFFQGKVPLKCSFVTLQVQDVKSAEQQFAESPVGGGVEQRAALLYCSLGSSSTLFFCLPVQNAPPPPPYIGLQRKGRK